MFLLGAAGAAYQRLLQQRVLKGKSIRRLMTAEPKTAPVDILVEDFVEDYVYKCGHVLFPLTSNGRLVGFFASIVSPGTAAQVGY